MEAARTVSSDQLLFGYADGSPAGTSPQPTGALSDGTESSRRTDQDANTTGKRTTPDLVVTSPKSLARPLGEARSLSGRSLASNMSDPVEPSVRHDCGATLGPDSGFYSAASGLSEGNQSYLLTGRRDNSEGLVEAGVDKYLHGDLTTASLLLKEALGQQVNHALELEYGGHDHWFGVTVGSHQGPQWMSG